MVGLSRPVAHYLPRCPSRQSIVPRGPGCSAVLSIRLTRVKPRGTPRAGAHQKQGPMQPFRCRGVSRGPEKLEAKGPATG